MLIAALGEKGVDVDYVQLEWDLVMLFKRHKITALQAASDEENLMDFLEAMEAIENPDEDGDDEN